jgi:histidyl-tRNA synthetase
MNIRAVKGMRDILPPSSSVWNHVETVARAIFRAYNYHEIRTPILEDTGLFTRGVGAETDIVGKEMYTFDDHGSSVTLRPEMTASVMRAYIEHRLDQLPGVKKFYYLGPMFRRERPQKGRYRQFFQIGGEAIGSESPLLDAEVIEMSVDILRKSGLTGFQVLINSVGCSDCRPPFVELLREKLKDLAPKMCGDCQRRAVTNPLRVLDCKVPEDQPIIETLPSILDHLDAKCATHFAAVRSALDQRRIAYEVRPRLVRGLDYYMRTTFEITHSGLGSQNTVLAGGRYDGLGESIGSKIPAPGVGFSMGEDRLVMTVEESIQLPADPLAIVAFTGDAFAKDNGPRNAALAAAAELRGAGIRVELAEGKLKKVFETANKLNARLAIIFGETEVAAGTASMKDLESHEQWTFPQGELVEQVKKCLNK